MPMDNTRYPPDWKGISLRVRAAAGNKCEWCGAKNGEPHPITGRRVVLTVAHVGEHKHDKMRTDALVALCQRCHLNEDLDDHIRHAAETRRRKRVEAGQLVLEIA